MRGMSSPRTEFLIGDERLQWEKGNSSRRGALSWKKKGSVDSSLQRAKVAQECQRTALLGQKVGAAK